MTISGLLYLAAILGGAVSGGAAAQTQTVPPTTTPAPAPVSPAVPAVPARTAPAANYVALGNFYYNQGNFDQAYVAFRSAAEMEPKNTDALLGLGRSQVKLRLYGAALDTLRRLVVLDSRNVSGYLALSQAYLQEYMGASTNRTAVAGNLAAALKVLTDAEAVAQTQAGKDRDLSLSKIWNERGYVYRLQSDGGKAIDAFKQASALDPENSIVLYNIGDMYYATGNLPQALDYLQQAVIADPRDAYNRAYYAKLLALSGNISAAKPEAAQAARLAPKNAYAVGQYGVVSYLAKDSVTAKAQLEQAVKLAPLNNAEFYYYLGRLSLDGGDLRAARYNFTYAVSLQAYSPEYLYYLGLSYERGSGIVAPDRQKAKANYELALKLNPSYKPAQEGLARVR